MKDKESVWDDMDVNKKSSIEPKYFAIFLSVPDFVNPLSSRISPEESTTKKSTSVFASLDSVLDSFWPLDDSESKISS